MAYTMFLAIVLASENKKKPDLIKQEIQLRCGVTLVGNRSYIVWLEPSNDNSYVRYTSTPPCFTPQR